MTTHEFEQAIREAFETGRYQPIRGAFVAPPSEGKDCVCGIEAVRREKSLPWRNGLWLDVIAEELGLHRMFVYGFLHGWDLDDPIGLAQNYAEGYALGKRLGCELVDGVCTL